MGRRGSEIAAAARREQSTELRCLGASYRQIGQQLQISHTQARKDVMAGLEAAHQHLGQLGERLLALEYQRLEVPMVALATRIKNGDLNAIDRWIRLSESRRRLLGLDAPEKSLIGDLPDFVDNFEQEILRDPERRKLLDQLCMPSLKRRADAEPKT